MMEYVRKSLMRVNYKIIPISRNLKGLNSFLPCYTQVKNLNNKSCTLTKVRRSLYLRLYPTLIVESDGSTYTVRHYEPRHIIKLPFDITKASPEERDLILRNRKPKVQAKVEEEEVLTINVNEYLNIMKKAKKK